MVAYFIPEFFSFTASEICYNVEQLLKIAESTHLIDAPQMRKVLVQTYLAADAVLNAYVMDD